MPKTVEVLVIAPIAEAALGRIAAVHSSIRAVDARGSFDSELAEDWPRWTALRYLPEPSASGPSRKDRDRLLATAEIILAGFPVPLEIRRRAPRLRWVHQLPAGASNLLRSDLWNSDVVVTTSRGYGNTRAMAEYVLACFLHFARGLPHAYHDRQFHRFDYRAYRPVGIEGKTVCVVGAGGIGQEVGRLCAVTGMRVVGTRRSTLAGMVPEGFSLLAPADSLHELLAQSDFIAVCCQWTPETTGLFGRDAFAAAKNGAVLVNVARGEIIDENALIEALARDKLRGVALDVYLGEFEREPDIRLWDDERVLITPHISAAGDISQHRGLDLFCENLRAYLDGLPLVNVIDWARGY